MAKVGRKTKMTEIVVKKLEEAFAMGCTDDEACIYANISRQTLYTYQNNNKEFLDRKELLKQTPILLARQTVIESLKIPQTAQWFLERKKKDEFTARQEIEHNVNVKLDDMRKELSDTIKYVKTKTAQDHTSGTSSVQTAA